MTTAKTDKIYHIRITGKEEFLADIKEELEAVKELKHELEATVALMQELSDRVSDRPASRN